MEEYKKETIETYNKIAKDFDGRNHDSFWSEELEAFKKLADPKTNRKIIEIGCGCGRDAEEIVKAGFDYTGIDLSEGMLKIAKKRVKGGEFKVMDLEHLEFPDKSFDCFWASAVFLHVPKKDIDRILMETKRVVKNGGMGFISLKKKTKIDEGMIQQKAISANRYFAFYTEEEFNEVLAKNGFKTEQIFHKTENDSQKQEWIIWLVREL